MKQKQIAVKVPTPGSPFFIKMGIELLVALLVILWVYTGITKLIENHDFHFQLARSVYLKEYAGFLAYSIPVLELGIAILLIIGKTRSLGLFSSFILMVAFTGYVYFILKFTNNLPCSCGGVISTLTWRDHLILNIVLTIISALGLFLHLRFRRNYTQS